MSNKNKAPNRRYAMTGKKVDIEKKKVMTPKFRVSFPKVFEAEAFDENQKAKFSLVMLFDKKENLKKMKNAAAAAMFEKFGKQSEWPKNYKWPFRDGDEERGDVDGYENTIFVNASSTKRPGLVNQKLEGIIDEEDFYAGCYARAELIAFAFEKKGNKGVAFSLQNVQKLGDGEAFSGKKKAEDVFDEVELDEDDESNYEDGEEDFDIPE